jgi:hypothetical protein
MPESVAPGGLGVFSNPDALHAVTPELLGLSLQVSADDQPAPGHRINGAKAVTARHKYWRIQLQSGALCLAPAHMFETRHGFNSSPMSPYR